MLHIIYSNHIPEKNSHRKSVNDIYKKIPENQPQDTVLNFLISRNGRKGGERLLCLESQLSNDQCNYNSKSIRTRKIKKDYLNFT